MYILSFIVRACVGAQCRAYPRSRCRDVAVLHDSSRPWAELVLLACSWRRLRVQHMSALNTCWKPGLVSSCSPPPLRASVLLFVSQPSYLRPEQAPHCRAMLSVLAYLASAILVRSSCVSGEAVLAFDGAAASSTYAGGDFAATEATSKGSGYWCRWVTSVHRLVYACPW